MFAENRKISLRQLQILLLLDCFGTAVLFLPAELAGLDGRACWVIALLGGIIFSLISLLLTTLGKKMPDTTIVGWCQKLLGDVLGNIVLVGLAANLLLEGMLELRLFSEIICRSMLPTTPVWVIALVILAVAGALAAQGMECRGRTAEVLFFFFVIPLVILLAAVAISAEYGRILPVEMPSWEGLRRGIPAMSIVFQGLIFLYFVFPELKKTEKAQRSVVLSMLLLTGFVTVIVFLCLAVYGEGTLANKLLPALQVMERVSFTGIFLTRQDVTLLWFWMVSVVIFLSGVLFFSALLGVQMFHQEETKRKKWLGAVLILLFALSFLPENLSEAYHLRMKIIPWFQGFYLVILPVILLILERKGGNRHV